MQGTGAFVILLTAALGWGPLPEAPPRVDIGITELAQNQISGGNRYRDDRRRPQRYVCVVPPPRSAGRSAPYVCRAGQGRIGGGCRCPGTVGSGSLQFSR